MVLSAIGEFVNKLLTNPNKIYNNLWVISFSGKLSFPQDLFSSKLYNLKKIYGKYYHYKYTGTEFVYFYDNMVEELIKLIETKNQI